MTNVNNTQITVNSAYGDFRFTSKVSATDFANLTRTAKGGAFMLLMNDGTYVVTCGRRAGAFVRQGNAVHMKAVLNSNN